MLEKMLNINTLTVTEEKINSYILQNRNAIKYMTIYDLAKKTFTSPSTIVRYSKKLGCNGFTDLKHALIEHSSEERMIPDNLSQLINVIQNSKSKNTDVAGFLQNYYEMNIHQITNSLSDQSLDKIAELIISSTRIIAIGVGSSFLQLQEFQLKLLKIGIHLNLIECQSEQFYLASYSKPSDLAILVSYSGNTAEVINDAKILKKNNSKILVITSDKTGVLAKLADYLIYIPKIDWQKNLHVDIMSSLSINYILTVIYFCVLKKVNIKELNPTPQSKFL